MSFRYAKSNGQFLKSKFLETVESADPNAFTQAQAYNLSKVLANGENPEQNSFVSDNPPTYYYDAGSSLVSWWRLNTNVSSAGSGADSSGHGHSLTPISDPADRPSFDSGDTPSSFIQESSCLFAGTQVLQAADSNSFVFGNGLRDFPFTISMWVKFSALGGNQGLVAKYTLAKSEWLVLARNTGMIELQLYDNPASLARVYSSTGAVSTGVWQHLVVTYDGSASSAAGSTSYNGMKIYLNGTLLTTSYQTSAAYKAMDDSNVKATVGNSFGETVGGVTGNMADVAIWGSELTQSDVTALYNIKTAGAYRLVRNFKQVSPENDTRLFGVQTESRGVDLSGLPSDILEQFRQGINVNTHKQLGSYTSFKIRSNNSFITTLNGVDVSTRTFDESLATTTFSSGSKSFSRISLGGKGKISSRISHEREHRDLGQPEVYVNYDNYEIYEDTLDLDPVAIVKTHPDKLLFPRQLVVQTSNELNDGAIEPLIIRKKIDHTSIEGPFFSHDIRASLGGLENSFRRSMVFVYGRDLDEPAEGTAPFLDSVEVFGATGSFGGVDLPGAFSTDFGTISPYVDYLNDRDKEYTTNGVSSIISTVMILSASFEDADIRTYDKMAPSGFVYDNGPIGIDSIAYGGLKK